MSKSKIMQDRKKEESEALGYISPSERLKLACELSDFCRQLGRAGAEAREKGRYGVIRKP